MRGPNGLIASRPKVDSAATRYYEAVWLSGGLALVHNKPYFGSAVRIAVGDR